MFHLDLQFMALVAGHLVRSITLCRWCLAGLCASRQIHDHTGDFALLAHGVLEEFHLASWGDCVQTVCGGHGVQVGAAAGAAHAMVDVTFAVALSAGVEVKGPLDAALHEWEGDGQIDQEEGGEKADSDRHDEGSARAASAASEYGTNVVKNISLFYLNGN